MGIRPSRVEKRQSPSCQRGISASSVTASGDSGMMCLSLLYLTRVSPISRFEIELAPAHVGCLGPAGAGQ